MDLIRECEITCPYCWENFTIIVEPEPAGLDFIQDCEVCCNPIQLVIGQGDEGQLLISPDKAN